MQHTAHVVALLLVGSLPAQGGLQLYGYDEPSSTPSGPTTSLDGYALAAIELRVDPGEVAVLFVNAVVDDVVAHQVAAGLPTIYPFLAPPAPWAGSDLVGYTVTNPNDVLIIPPGRVLDHLDAVVGLAPSSYGHHNTGGEPADVFFAPGSWSAVAPHDERKGWATATWQPAIGPNNGAVVVVDLFTLAHGAIRQEIEKEYLGQGHLLDPEGVTALINVLDLEIKVAFHVQAARIRIDTTGHPTTSPPSITLSPPVVMRRHSLKDLAGDPWFAAMGPERHFPAVVDGEQWFYLAGIGEQLHVHFDRPVSGLRAVCPIKFGGMAVLGQLDNPVVGGVPLNPHIAVFDFPTDGTHGFTWFLDGAGNVVPPKHAVLDAALTWAFTPFE